MSKLVPFLFAGTGAAAISVGGVYLVKNGISTGTGESSTPTTQGQKESNKPLEFDSLAKFKTGKGGGCATEVFGSELDMSGVDSAGDIASTSPNSDTYFGTAPGDATNTKGCLIIHWETKKYAGEKWTGNFTWTWSFRNQDKGFILFNVAKATNAREMTVDGGIYLLEKTNTGGTTKWEVKHKKELTSDSRKISSSEFTSKFPKAKTGSPVRIEDKDYWGFVEDGSKTDNICVVGSDCSGDPTSVSQENKKWTWSWSAAAGGSKIKDWCEDMNWWNQLYDNSTFNLGTKLDGFTGTWSPSS